MISITSRAFEFEGRTYEIRVVSDGSEYKIAVFLGDHRANGYAYTASVITDVDMQLTYGMHAYEHLMDVAESDVRQKYWERHLETVRALRAATNRSS